MQVSDRSRHVLVVGADERNVADDEQLFSAAVDKYLPEASGQATKHPADAKTRSGAPMAYTVELGHEFIE